MSKQLSRSFVSKYLATDVRVEGRGYNCVILHGLIVIIVIIFFLYNIILLFYFVLVWYAGQVRLGRARGIFSLAHAHVGCRSTRRNGLRRGRRSGRSQDNNMTYSLRQVDEWRWCHLSRDTLTVITSTQGPSA